jgi:hypothetical protein
VEICDEELGIHLRRTVEPHDQQDIEENRKGVERAENRFLVALNLFAEFGVFCLAVLSLLRLLLRWLRLWPRRAAEDLIPDFNNQQEP